MNKILLFNSRLSQTLENPIKGEILGKPAETPEKNKQLLDYIFAVDPATGKPKGDLACFLGENTNPEVKAFIEMNLLKDNVQLQQSASIPQNILNKMSEVINDDDIAFFSRNDGEDREEYAERLHKYFEEERYINGLRKRNERLKKLIKEADKD